MASLPVGSFRLALHAWHRAHGLALVLPVQHKDRVDQVVRCDPVLTHQIAGEFVTAQAAWAVGGEGGDRVHIENCA
jgi:hypothetical protein